MFSLKMGTAAKSLWQRQFSGIDEDCRRTPAVSPSWRPRHRRHFSPDCVGTAEIKGFADDDPRRGRAAGQNISALLDAKRSEWLDLR